MHLSDSLVSKLVDKQIYSIVISFSGATPDDYESVYHGGKWNVVLEGIEKISKCKADKNNDFPIICINS